MLSYLLFKSWFSKPGVPHLQDLMLNDLRWSWCDNNRNKVHNKCNAFGSSWNHPPNTVPWKNCLPQNQSLVPKRLGTAALNYKCFFHPFITRHGSSSFITHIAFLWKQIQKNAFLKVIKQIFKYLKELKVYRV